MKTYLLLWASISALTCWAEENYADLEVERLRAELKAFETSGSTLDVVLKAEELYYLSHESSRQVEIRDAIAGAYESVEELEARAELGFLLAQIYRQLGEYGAIEKLIRELGYVSQWRVLGPLVPDSIDQLKSVLKMNRVKGLNREVGWHAVRAFGKEDFFSEGLGHYGHFNANHAVFPSQLAGALFSGWFYVPEKTSLRLGLGWGHRIKAWINYQLVLEETADQKPHPDQAIVLFEVKKGWHRISLLTESSAEQTGLGFFARLTSQNGVPIEVKAENKGRMASKKVRSHHIQESELMASARSHSPLKLGSMMLIKELGRTEDGTPIDQFELALKEEPSRYGLEKLLSLVQEPNRRWAYLTRFLENHPDSAWAYTQLGQIALGQQRFWEARHYASLALDHQPGYWPADVLHNNTLASLRLEGQSLRNTEALNQRFPDVPWLMMDLADLYWRLNFYRKSGPVLDEILKIRGGLGKYHERKLADLKRSSDIEGLDSFYRQLLKDAPYSVSRAIEYAGFLVANRRWDAADDLLSRFLTQLPENPYLLEVYGDLKLRAGERAEAEVLFARALEIQPQNPDLEKRLTWSQSDGVAFYEPYRIEDSPTIPLRERSGVVINFDNTVRKVSPDGQSSVFHQIEYEIVTEAGTQEIPGYSFSYAPLRQSVELIKAEVVRGDQRLIITAKGRSRISDPEYKTYYDLIAYQIGFPPLEVNDKIRIEYRIDDDKDQNIFGDYFGDLTYFSAEYPMRQVSYTLLVPKQRTIYYQAEKMDPEFTQSEDGDYRVYQWTLRQTNSFETESRMPGLAGYLPYLSISTFANWSDMTSWYADLIEKQLELNFETRQIVRDLTEGISDRREIVKLIHQYVIMNTRYVALEFGIHGYKPYAVNQVCSRQFGDCKDKASLMIALLREAGVEAEIVIVRTYDKGEIETYPPSLSYFNHAIAYVPEFDLYLDGTAEFSGMAELPEMDQGALALRVDRKGKGHLVTIPVSDENMRRYQLDLTLNPDGEAQVEGRLSYLGSPAPSLRQYLSIDSRLDTNLQKLMVGYIPGLNVATAQRSGNELNDPIDLVFTGSTRQLFRDSSRGFRLPLKILNNNLTQSYTPNAKRRFPVEMGLPRTKSVSVKVHIPEGFQVADLPEPLELEDENFAIKIDFERASKREFEMNYMVKVKANRIDPEAYVSLREMLLAHDQMIEKYIQFTR